MATTKQAIICPCGGQPAATTRRAVRRNKPGEVDLLSLKHESIYPGCGNGYLSQLEKEAKDGFKVRSTFLADQLGNIIAEQRPVKETNYVELAGKVPISLSDAAGGLHVNKKHLMSPCAWHAHCKQLSTRETFGDEFVQHAETPYTEPNVKWSGVTLSFSAYFTEQDPLRDIKSAPRLLAHVCTLQYFMEDDTAQLNQLRGPSKQGRQRLIGRRRMLITMPPSSSNLSNVLQQNVSKQYITQRELNWRDLQVGVELQLYAFHIKLIDADEFSRTLLKSLGIEIAAPIEVPESLFDRPKDWSHLPNQTKYLNVDGSWRTGDSEREKFQKFMCNTSRLLAFTVIYNDLHALYGDLHLFQLRFHLEDGTFEVVVHPEKAYRIKGYDPWQIYLHRAKCQSKTDCDPRTGLPRYLEPKDIRIGQYLRIHDRSFLVCDCDTATSQWYAENLNIPNFGNVVIDWRRMLDEYDTSGMQPRLYTCSKNDSSQKTYKPGTVNGGEQRRLVDEDENSSRERRLSQSSGAQPTLFRRPDYTLRFIAELISEAAYNNGRRFIIRFWTVDGTMAIYEVRQNNSGHIGGQLLARSRVYKTTLGDCLPRIELMYKIHDSPYGEEPRGLQPTFSIDADTIAAKKAGGSENAANEKEFIEISDLYIGSILNIRGTLYRIIDCDGEVLQFASQHPWLWSAGQIEELKVACRRHGYERNEYGFCDKEFERESDNNEHWSNVLEQALRRIVAEKKKHLFGVFVQKYGQTSGAEPLNAEHVMFLADTYSLPSSRPVALEVLRRFHDWADRNTIAGGCVSAGECKIEAASKAKQDGSNSVGARRSKDVVTFVRYLLQDGLGPYYHRLMKQANCVEPGSQAKDR